jgi:hypothetical protein
MNRSKVGIVAISDGQATRQRARPAVCVSRACGCNRDVEVSSAVPRQTRTETFNVLGGSNSSPKSSDHRRSFIVDGWPAARKVTQKCLGFLRPDRGPQRFVSRKCRAPFRVPFTLTHRISSGIPPGGPNSPLRDSLCGQCGNQTLGGSETQPERLVLLPSERWGVSRAGGSPHCQWWHSGCQWHCQWHLRPCQCSASGRIAAGIRDAERFLPCGCYRTSSSPVQIIVRCRPTKTSGPHACGTVQKRVRSREENSDSEFEGCTSDRLGS